MQALAGPVAWTWRHARSLALTAIALTAVLFQQSGDKSRRASSWCDTRMRSLVENEFAEREVNCAMTGTQRFPATDRPPPDPAGHPVARSDYRSFAHCCRKHRIVVNRSLEMATKRRVRRQAANFSALETDSAPG